MHAWLQTLHDRLRALEAYEREEHDRLAGLDLDERVSAGVSWSPVRIEDVRPDGRRYEVVVRGGLHDGIGVGDRVSLGEVSGRVVGADERAAELLCDGEPTGDETEVRRLFDPGTMVRFRQTLERVDTESPSALVRALLEPAASTVEPDATPCERLNPAQRQAVDRALAEPSLAMIHGPPGTGKTTVLGELLWRLVQQGDRPWALAASNAAVDHLAATAAARGLTVVRVGVTARMSGAVRDLSLAAWIARSPLAPALRQIDRELSRVRSRRGPGHELGKLFDERRRLRQSARDWALGQASVIATTFGTLAHQVLDTPRLPIPHTAVVDEATQAMEPAVWVAARWVERLILVGDPHQLGPVVRQPGNGLERSILDRLLAVREAPMLEVQHRMHADIQALVRDVYGPTYRAHADVAAQSVCEEPPVRFVDTAGSGVEEAVDPVSRSLFHPLEIELVGRALNRFRALGVADGDMVVLAPYSAQVGRLRSAYPSVEVATINSFQGREAPIVLLSLVRSNPDGALGFLADERRLTVALTRARAHLWVCGDSATLANHPRFARLLESIEILGGLSSVWDPEWDVSPA